MAEVQVVQLFAQERQVVFPWANMPEGQMDRQPVPWRTKPETQLVQVVDELTQELQGEVQPTQIWFTASMNIVGWQVVTQLFEEFRK